MYGLLLIIAIMGEGIPSTGKALNSITILQETDLTESERRLARVLITRMYDIKHQAMEEVRAEIEKSEKKRKLEVEEHWHTFQSKMIMFYMAIGGMIVVAMLLLLLDRLKRKQ